MAAQLCAPLHDAMLRRHIATSVVKRSWGNACVSFDMLLAMLVAVLEQVRALSHVPARALPQTAAAIAHRPQRCESVLPCWRGRRTLTATKL